jgi:hypothetical protein
MMRAVHVVFSGTPEGHNSNKRGGTARTEMGQVHRGLAAAPRASKLCPMRTSSVLEFAAGLAGFRISSSYSSRSDERIAFITTMATRPQRHN